ncbi:MAG: ABC transporter permease [Bacteroidota bacterium]
MNSFRRNIIYFLRSIRKNPSFAILNICGLSFGITAFIYILSYVEYEERFDTHHKHAENIYRITSQKVQDGMPQPAKASASVALAPYISKEIPGIEAITRIHPVKYKELMQQRHLL